MVALGQLLHPLDALPGWVGMYGRAGVVQYQAAIPGGGEQALIALLKRVAEGPVAPCLAALKRLGRGTGHLSFPLPGWSSATMLSMRRAGLDVHAKETTVVVLDAVSGEIWVQRIEGRVG